MIMEEARKLIEELKGLIGKTDEQSVARIDEISLWFRDHHTPENIAMMQEFLEEGVAEVGAEIVDIRHQIDDEQYRLLPISYIARKYFGKSHAWLSQRINGTKVRGRVYTLNAEQKQIFNNAMQDLSRFYSTFRIA
jgi:hypothetical protein